MRWFGAGVAQGLKRPENIVMLLVSVGVSIALLYPLAIVVFKSFQVETGLVSAEYSLKNYEAFAAPRTILAIKNSFIIAAVSAAFISGPIGVLLAWIQVRTNTPFRRTLHSLTLVPFFISPLVGAFAWSLLASPRVGLLNVAARYVFGLENAPFNIYTMAGVIWVEGLFHAPFVYLFCIGPLKNMDPALEEAARLSGANWISTNLRVTLPLAAPAIISAVILSFVLTIEELGAPLVLGAPYGVTTMSILIFEGVNRFPANYNFGAALGVFMVFVTGLAILFQRRLMRSRSYSTMTGRGFRPTEIDLGRARYLTLAVGIAYLLLAMILPLLILAIVSLQRAWLGQLNPALFTTQYYAYILGNNPLALRGLINSTVLAAAGASISIALAVVVAYVIHRTKSPGRGLLDVVTTMPIGISGLVMAVGILLALIRTPLYGTLWIILAAYVIRYFTYGQRSISAALISVSKDLEESARTSGATWSTTIRRVIAPLVAPGLIGGWILLFITFMRESSMSLLLSKSGTETLSVALFNLLANDPIGAVAAFTLVQVFIILLLFALLFRVVGHDAIKV